MTSCAKILVMGYFESRLDEALAEAGTTLYKVAMSIGQDPVRISNILYMRRPTSFDKRLEALRQISESKLLEGFIDYPTLAAWLAYDYLPEESLRLLVDAKYKQDPALKRAISQYKRKPRMVQSKLPLDKET